MDEAQSAFSQRFAPFIKENNVMYLYAEFDNAYRDIASNGNGKLVFLDLAIKVSKLIRVQ
jgi:DNA polymerase-3 subunit delta'